MKILQMLQNLQTFPKFQKIQLENLIDFEKCCKTHIFLQKSEPIQPKTSNIMPKFCQPTLSDVSAGCADVRVELDVDRSRASLVPTLHFELKRLVPMGCGASKVYAVTIALLEGTGPQMFCRSKQRTNTQKEKK